jgi:hypothetical protein
MNISLNNISVIILLIGIILITVYVTRATSSRFKTKEQQLADINNGLRRKKYVENIYDIRPSKTFRDMFVEPPIWLGYKKFDPSDVTDKVYIKP